MANQNIERTDLSVRNIAELKAVHVAQLRDGTEAWVSDIKQSFRLLKASDLIPDDVTVIQPGKGSPRSGAATAVWASEDQGDQSQEFAKQPVWYIDPVNGNDNRNGKTPASALKTHEELVRRIDGALINIPVTVFLMNDFPADNPVHVVFRIGSGSMTYLSIKPMTTLFTGSFTAVNNIIPASNQAQIVEDLSLGVGGWAALVNAATGPANRIRITSGPNVGAIAYPSRDLGADEVRTSPFVVPQTGLPIQNTIAVLQPNPGDPYVVETGLLLIQDFLVDAEASTVNPTSTNVRLFFKDIAIPNDIPIQAVIQLTGAGADGVGDVFFSACDVGRIDVRACRVVCDASKLSGLQNEIKYGALSVSTGLITQQLTAASGSRRTALSLHTLFDIGGRLFVENTTLITAAAVFNSGTDGITVRSGGTLRAFTFTDPPVVYGSNNGLFGMNILPGGKFMYQDNKPTIVGNQGELVVADMPDGWNLFGDDLVNDVKQAGISRTT